MTRIMSHSFLNVFQTSQKQNFKDNCFSKKKKKNKEMNQLIPVACFIEKKFK